MGPMLAILLTAAAFAPADLPAFSIDGPAGVVDLAPGDEGPAVERLQDALTVAGYRPGETDGVFGRATYQAVIAFQKHHGLDRTGVFRAEHWGLLAVRPSVRVRSQANRVEIDLGKQVLYYVTDNRVDFVLPISSGNGATFTNSSGNQVRARTPEGRFEFYFERPYNHTSYLGAMYKPYYFRGGYAIHGSPSVPPQPASHGCIRVTNADMDFLRGHLQIGLPIYVYGQRTEVPPGIAQPPTRAARAA